jgi:hypothetical protein
MRTTSTYWKWVGALGAVFVPSIVMALTIPHEFSAGDPILSAEVNANFSAIATAVTDLEDRVDDVEDGLSGLSLTCETVVSADLEVDADATGSVNINCDGVAGSVLTGGGCRTGFPAGGISYIPSYGFPNDSGSYICRLANTAATTRTIRAYGRCCSVE